MSSSECIRQALLGAADNLAAAYARSEEAHVYDDIVQRLGERPVEELRRDRYWRPVFDFLDIFDDTYNHGFRQMGGEMPWESASALLDELRAGLRESPAKIPRALIDFVA